MHTHQKLLLSPDGDVGGGNEPDNTKIIAAAADKARTEERAKVQGVIDGLRAEVTALTGKLNESVSALTITKTELESKTAAFDTLKASIKDDGSGHVDYAKLIEETVAKAQLAAQANLSTEIEALRTQLSESQQKQLKLEVERMRSRLIKASGGEDVMIVELVTGDTQEAILASIEKAKAAYQRVAGSNTNKTKQAGSSVLDDDDDLPPVVSGVGDGTPTNIKGLSLSEFAKVRAKLLKSTSGRYANSPLR